MLKYQLMQTILIVEDKESMAQMLKETLDAEGYRTIIALDGADGIKKIKTESPDMVLTDLKLPGADGIEVLKASKQESQLRPVLLMTAHGSVDAAVKAMKEGAYDFITKPFNIDHLLMLIKRSLDNQRILTENIILKDVLSNRVGLPNIIGGSGAIMEAASKIKKAAPSKTTILLLGESGTGKELFARAIHHLSGRQAHPFVAVNSAAIPKGLLEAELFGFEKGSFTGADAKKPGKFELAHRGTLFLDEIGELDIELQAKLLRVIQEGEIERIGGTAPVKIDVRLVAASNKDLEKAVSDGSFRQDLYYRLNVFPIRIPPLRERPDDIPLLIDHFMDKLKTELNSPVTGISDDALELLKKYPWKGNVRELENTMERALILCEGDKILPEHVSLIRESEAEAPAVPMDGSLEDAARAALKAAETERIRLALKETGGNKSKASLLLKVSYKTLLTKIKEYNI